MWLGHHRKINPWGLFALYVAGYSAFRIFEESLRVDPSEHFLGLRLNMYVAIALTIAGLAWFWQVQRRQPAAAGPPGSGAGDTAAEQPENGETGGEDEPEQPAGDATPAEVGAERGAQADGPAPPPAEDSSSGG